MSSLNLDNMLPEIEKTEPAAPTTDSIREQQQYKNNAKAERVKGNAKPSNGLSDLGDQEIDHLVQEGESLLQQDAQKYDIRRRVGLDNTAEWKPLSDNAISQGDSVYLGALYENGKYWITSSEDDWLPVNSETVKQFLNVEKGVPVRPPEGGGLNPMKAAMNTIVRYANVGYATQLAGYPKGIYSFDGKRVLVTSSPTIIEPKKGSWGTIKNLLFQMFGAEQLEFLFGWLRIAYTTLISGAFTPGQIPVFAGPRDCGKTLIQNLIITPLLGGRDAKPYQYMTGMTSFNADLFKAEHLIISDENPSTEMRDRRAFGAAIKNLTVEPKQRLHAKGRDALILAPFWRVTISVNDEPENLMILPPLDDSILDKLMLFHVSRPTCLPKDAEGDRQKFGKAIKSELPAFVHFLVKEHQIRPELKKGRFGIREYHNENLVLGVEALSAEAALMDMVHQEVFKGDFKDEWTGTAADLMAVLKSRDSSVKMEAEKYIPSSRKAGRLLSNLEKSKGLHRGEVTSKTANGYRRFTIFRTMRSHEGE